MPIIDSYPEPFIPPSTASRTKFTLDILPDTVGSRRLTHWLPRLKVDGAEIKIKPRPRLQQSETEIGWTLTCELLKVSDKSAFDDPTTIEFGFGSQDQFGVWDEATFVTKIENGIVDSLVEEIGGTAQQPTDRIAVTIIDQTTDRLNRTSETGLIIYDPSKVQIGDVTTIYDKHGNAYTPELMAINGLKLSRLFQEILVQRCGFSSYETNLPENDYPVDQYSVAFGERFWDGLKPFIGMYKPGTYAVGDIIRISDSTLPQPAGFPAPREVTLSRTKDQLQLTRQRQKLDALLLHFVGLENNYDFTAPRFEYSTDGGDGSYTETERIILEFHKRTRPGESVIVREEVNIENKRTFSFGVEIERSSEVWEFDGRGRHTARQLTKQARVSPTTVSVGSTWIGTFQGITREVNVRIDSGTPTLRRVGEERERVFHAPHPFKARSEYVQRRTYSGEGAIAVDAENTMPDGTPQFRDLLTQYRSANVQEGQYVIGNAKIRSREESAFPLKDGQSRIKTREIDEISGLVILDSNEVRPGEIALSAVATTNQIMPIFAEDNPTRSLDRTENLNIGPLPLKYGIPLAERRLIQMQQSDGTVQLPVIGYDEALEIGVPIAPKDRDGVSLGNFLIVGIGIDFLPMGLIMNLQCRQIATSDRELQEIPAYVRTIDEGQTLTFTLPIGCTDGYELRVPQGAVPNVTIEARHVEVPELPWTDLEANSIDLSAWDGLTEDFEFRITAGAVAVITRVEFDLEVDVA